MDPEESVLDQAEGEELEQELPEGEEGEEGGEGVDEELLSKAREMGWVPKEEWRGDPDRWTDADEYVRKGEEVLPIIRASNRRLAQELQAKDQELAKTKQALEEMQDSIQVIQGIQHREAVGRIDRAIRVKRTEIEEARSARETDRVVELQEELDALETEKETLGEEPKPRKGKPKRQVEEEGDDEGYEPPAHLKNEIAEWREENEWFGQDKIRTRMMDAVAKEVRADPKFRKAVGRTFLEECARRVDEELEESGVVQRRVSKVSGGSQSGNRRAPVSTRRGKSYADLPADAKAACDADAKRVVGANKAFKDENAYRSWYVKEYFGGEA